MPEQQDGDAYVTATEAAKVLELSRQAFYQSVKPLLKTYKLHGRQHRYYKISEVQALKGVQQVGNMPIVVQGLQKNFEKDMRARGLSVAVETIGTPSIVQMDAHIASVFGRAIGSPVVLRRRRQNVMNTPYRLVMNYYPEELAGGDILVAMQTDDEADVLELIREQHHLVIERAHDLVSARHGSVEERRLLGIGIHEPVIEILRTNYADDGKTIIMFNELVLVAGHFILEYEYGVPHWKVSAPAGR